MIPDLPLLSATALLLAVVSAFQAQAANDVTEATAPDCIASGPAPGLGLPIVADADSTTLRIGVRKYAGPFSYFSDKGLDVWSADPKAPLAKARYTGYMSKICDAVLADMLLNNTGLLVDFDRDNIQVVDVDCLTENKIPPDSDTPLAQDASISRFAYLGERIDILCDPATITNERRHGFILSPPLFLSGTGMISRSNNPVTRGACPDSHLIGQVANTTASKDGIIKVLQSNELNRWADLLKAYIKEGEPKNNCSTAARGDVMLVKQYSNHKLAREAFCNDEFHFYLGDREIITYNARSVAGCANEIEGAGQTYSNDRYAIYGKMSYEPGDEKHDLLITRFFELLSQKVLIRPSLLDTAYQNTFLENPSQKLEAFYWSIRGPK